MSDAIERAEEWLATEPHNMQICSEKTGQLIRDLVAELKEAQLIISGKTFYDVGKATARDCAKIADAGVQEVAQHSCCDTCYALDKMRDVTRDIHRKYKLEE